jgi:peroxiredoxin Q/BCP
MLELGQIAPDFTLKDHNDLEVRLGDLRGSWVVLYFYPKDDTPGCTVEACEFTDGLERFQGLSARVFGISPDSPASHRKFIAKHSLKVGLLSDPEHGMIERYRAWGEKNMYGKKSFGVVRSTVLLDPAGRVAKHWPKVSAAGHAGEVAAALSELQGAPAGPRIAQPAEQKAAKDKVAKDKAAKNKAAKAQPARKMAAKAGPDCKSSAEDEVNKMVNEIMKELKMRELERSRARNAKVKPASKTTARTVKKVAVRSAATKASATKGAAAKASAAKSAAAQSARGDSKAGSESSAAPGDTKTKQARAKTQPKSARRSKG